tara:strand:+ start:492 stop:836 length:345 start_codon:yes stop_codon:yes gene_type:complete
MTMITPEQEIADSEELFSSLKNAISDLRREIESLKEQAVSGEEINETAATKVIGKVTGMVGTCAKVETYLNDCRNRQAGIARGGYALDLDKARVEIGCKLDRLRRCGGTGPVSE